VRGTEQFHAVSGFWAEMEQLGQLGYKEVTLLGQNIDAYGRDLPGVTSEAVSIRLQTFYYVHDVRRFGRSVCHQSSSLFHRAPDCVLSCPSVSIFTFPFSLEITRC